ncbi:MAG: SDR family oxidoreductase [Paludibacter sp.]|nr:SDR family oxidoreductase [Paludibacter sp.]
MNANEVKQTALITGASGGIGYEIAKLFAIDGVNLILIARSADKLVQIKQIFEKDYKITVKVIAADLSSEKYLPQIIESIDKENITINYLVNNAGFGLQDAFLKGSVDTYSLMVNLNISTLTYLTRVVGEKMVKNGNGRILNIASIAAFQPDPYFAVYGATKAYVLNFSEAIHKEFEKTGVSVTALSPGLTKTGFIDRAEMQGSNMLKAGIMPAILVAKAGYKGMMKGKRHVVPGFSNKIMAFFTWLFPTSAFKLSLLAMIMKK